MGNEVLLGQAARSWFVLCPARAVMVLPGITEAGCGKSFHEGAMRPRMLAALETAA